MVEHLPIRVLGKSDGVNGYRRKVETTCLDFDILGESVHFRIGVAKKQASLADIVPLAQAVCTKIVNVVVEKIRREGGRVPCWKGCSACCRYIVPLSVPEAFWLREKIFARPVSEQKIILQSCLSAAVRILGRKLPKPLAGLASGTSPDSSLDINAVVNWYANLKLDCPFLYKGVCLIYEQRPLVCREYFIKGSARACKGGRGKAKVVELPVRMSRVLSQFASELEGVDEEAAVIPLALSWCEENLERSKRVWPAAMMVERFVEIVKAMASPSASEAPGTKGR